MNTWNRRKEERKNEKSEKDLLKEPSLRSFIDLEVLGSREKWRRIYLSLVLTIAFSRGLVPLLHLCLAESGKS